VPARLEDEGARAAVRLQLVHHRDQARVEERLQARARIPETQNAATQREIAPFSSHIIHDCTTNSGYIRMWVDLRKNRFASKLPPGWVAYRSSAMAAGRCKCHSTCAALRSIFAWMREQKYKCRKYNCRKYQSIIFEQRHLPDDWVILVIEHLCGAFRCASSS